MADKKEIFAIGADHAGYDLKEYLKSKMTELGYEISDYGTFSEDSVDYPDMIHPLAKDINDCKLKTG
ncbi:MAG: RpiB/LacA/LacB family sugar-phosphate isomerase, partial [Bacteroidota bacterium]